MRRLVLLLLAAPLLLAGCLGGGPEDPPAVSSPVASSPAPSPVPSTGPPVGSTPAPTPAAPESRVVYNGSHDFTGPPAPPNAPPRSENFTVDAGYGTLQVRIVFTSTSGPTGDVSLSAGAVVRVVDPVGAVAVECSGKDDPDCTKDLPSPGAGAWKVEYAGSATSKATVTVTEIP